MVANGKNRRQNSRRYLSMAEPDGGFRGVFRDGAIPETLELATGPGDAAPSSVSGLGGVLVIPRI